MVPRLGAARRRTPARQGGRGRRAGGSRRRFPSPPAARGLRRRRHGAHHARRCGVIGQGSRVWTVNRWIVGARPRTLPAAVVPVALGVGCAAGLGPISWWRAALGARRQPRPAGRRQLRQRLLRRRARHRRRPGRSGAPGGVRAGGAGGGEAGGAAGLRRGRRGRTCSSLRRRRGGCWPSASRSIAAAWGYTGGPRPYGYLGLGEVFVFVFFGLVATVGTTYVSVETITGLSVVIGCAAGFVACALLVVNNLRDIPTDAAAGKRTLAVRLGDRRTRWMYVALVVATFGAVVVAAVVWRPAALRRARRRRLRRVAGAARPGRSEWAGTDRRARRDRPTTARLRRADDARSGCRRVGGLTVGRSAAATGWSSSQRRSAARKPVGCSRWTAWPAPASDRRRGAGDRRGHALGDRRELGVELRRRRGARASPGSRGAATATAARRCRRGAGWRPGRPPCCRGGRRGSRASGGRLANSGRASQSSRKCGDAVAFEVRGAAFVVGSPGGPVVRRRRGRRWR